MIESAQVTRWLVLAALSVATVVMFAVSLRGNYLYGYSIGQTDEKRQLFAWANVAADLWKAFGLIAVTMLWRARRRRGALLASFAWLACLLFGINSALGVYVQDRAALTGGREARHATYNDLEKELAGVQAKLREPGSQRSVGEIDAAIDALLGRAVVVGDRVRGTVAALSRNCTKIDARTSDACEQVAQLRVERSGAVAAEKLEERARALRLQIAALRDTGSSVAPDPVGEFYAWLTGGFVSVRDVAFGFPLFFALMIEVVSTFGPATIAAYAEASRSMTQPAAAGHDALRHAVAGPSEPEDGHVLSWLAERAVPVAGNRASSVDELHGDYAQWCSAGGKNSVSAIAFEEAFDRARELPELAGKIRKFGKRYYGIGLVRRPRSIAVAGLVGRR
jgi:hypothetical protein